MTWLVIDTETTALFQKGLPPEHPTQPNALQVSAILFNADHTVETEIKNALLKPKDEWAMTKEAERIHGITRERASRKGIRPEVALAALCDLSKTTRRVLAYDTEFDLGVLSGMLLRMGIDPSKSINGPHLKWTCVKELATIPCGLEREDGSLKWPSLSEAVEILLGREHVNAHSSWDDAWATWEVYRALQDRGLLLPEAA